jgi:CRP/FNR family transcriptional regulator
MLTAAKEINALVNLFHQGTKLTFKKGDFLIPEGESMEDVLYIASGLVKVYDVTKYNEENLLFIRKSGDILGITSIASAHQKKCQRPPLYTAIENTVVFCVTRKQFVTFLKQDSTAALPLVDMLVEMYCDNVKRIMDLGYRSVRERLVSFLLSHAQRFGHKNTDGNLIVKIPLRHQEIASSISATRETVSRELVALEASGLIYRDKKRNTLTIKDMVQLKRFLD